MARARWSQTMVPETRRTLEFRSYEGRIIGKTAKYVLQPPESGYFADVPVGYEPDFRSKTLPQSSCPLFANLPLEIRLLIYRELRYYQGQHALESLREIYTLDDFPLSNPLLHRRRTTGLVRGGRHHPDDTGYDLKMIKVNMLGLLRSCRRIYAEVIDLLYTSNEFHIGDGTALWMFTRHTHPLHLQHIRNLHFVLSYRPRYGFEPDMMEWRSNWDDLAGLKGLSKLTVLIGERCGSREKREEYLFNRDWSCCKWTEVEADLLKDATKIVGVNFRLILPWPQGPKELPMIDGVVERCVDEILRR